MLIVVVKLRFVWLKSDMETVLLHKSRKCANSWYFCSVFVLETDTHVWVYSPF